MDVILTAGGTPTPEEPLYAYCNDLPKAMIPIGDKPMISVGVGCIGCCQDH